jgi:hypothetical protein
MRNGEGQLLRVPSLPIELVFVADQHDIGRLVQERSQAPIAALRYVADVVDLARLVPSWNQAKIGADVSGSTDTRRIIDCGHKGERGRLAAPGRVISQRQAAEALAMRLMSVWEISGNNVTDLFA